eukprot:TRINITY_DN15425_c0_g1_i1.p3 TRINITY_DN15425_c0_g1~~TRINITY_DN15425_c0_g1_i1.p3  ORF type:complete len:112 (-),score=11.95 TRINITY_DN15425_c0_g1_i1:160-495(-)
MINHNFGNPEQPKSLRVPKAQRDKAHAGIREDRKNKGLLEHQGMINRVNGYQGLKSHNLGPKENNVFKGIAANAPQPELNVEENEKKLEEWTDKKGVERERKAVMQTKPIQ